MHTMKMLTVCLGLGALILWPTANVPAALSDQPSATVVADQGFQPESPQEQQRKQEQLQKQNLQEQQRLQPESLKQGMDIPPYK